jgi:SAM-dependent methyltransferase
VEDQSKDIIVIFGVLHHIPEWRKVISECARVLRPGGRLFVEEPDGGFIVDYWERVFHWGHPYEMLRLRQLESALEQNGLEIQRKVWAFGFGVYAARKDGLKN